MYVTTSALSVWKAYRGARRRLRSQVTIVTHKLGKLERTIEHIGEGAGELADARLRLDRSLKRARLLTQAAGEAWVLLGGIRSLRPKK